MAACSALPRQPTSRFFRRSPFPLFLLLGGATSFLFSGCVALWRFLLCRATLLALGGNALALLLGRDATLLFFLGGAALLRFRGGAAALLFGGGALTFLGFGATRGVDACGEIAPGLGLAELRARLAHALFRAVQSALVDQARDRRCFRAHFLKVLALGLAARDLRLRPRDETLPGGVGAMLGATGFEPRQRALRLARAEVALRRRQHLLQAPKAGGGLLATETLFLAAALRFRLRSLLLLFEATCHRLFAQAALFLLATRLRLLAQLALFFLASSLRFLAQPALLRQPSSLGLLLLALFLLPAQLLFALPLFFFLLAPLGLLAPAQLEHALALALREVGAQSRDPLFDLAEAHVVAEASGGLGQHALCVVGALTREVGVDLGDCRRDRSCRARSRSRSSILRRSASNPTRSSSRRGSGRRGARGFELTIRVVDLSARAACRSSPPPAAAQSGVGSPRRVEPRQLGIPSAAAPRHCSNRARGLLDASDGDEERSLPASSDASASSGAPFASSRGLALPALVLRGDLRLALALG